MFWPITADTRLEFVWPAIVRRMAWMDYKLALFVNFGRNFKERTMTALLEHHDIRSRKTRAWKDIQVVIEEMISSFISRLEMKKSTNSLSRLERAEKERSRNVFRNYTQS